MFGIKKAFPVAQQVRRLTAANFVSPAVLKKGRTLIAVHTGYLNPHIYDNTAICFQPAIAIMGSVRFDHIYEHTHDQFPSYLKRFHAGTLVHSYFERNAKYYIPGVKGSDYVLIGGMYNMCHFDAFSHLLQQIMLGIRAKVSASVTFPTFCIYDALNTEESNWDTYVPFIINPGSDFSRYISYFKEMINEKNAELSATNRPERISWKIFNQNASNTETSVTPENSPSISMNIVNDLGTLRELFSGSFNNFNSYPADR